MHKFFRTPLFLVCASAATIVVAQTAVENYAAKAAQGANSTYQQTRPNDGVTKSARAYSQGSTLVHEYVLSIREDVTEKELQTWRSGTRGEVVPATCTKLKSDEFFKSRGFQVTYKYINTHGKVLDEFTVNKASCSAY